MELTTAERDIHALKVQYRVGDMYAPRLDLGEALYYQVGHIVRCLREKERPIASGSLGLEIVKQLEAAERSVRNESAKEKI